MNRIETRIIIMVTNRLAAAKDSDAKAEMIEELSENLYQRYLELVEGGTAEEEALKQALDSLGDVEELLAFLEEEEGGAQAAAGRAARPEVGSTQTEAGAAARPEAGSDERAESDGPSKTAREEAGAAGRAAREEKTSSFSREDLENGIEEIVNAAISATKVAVDCARDVAKDVSDQFKERYPDGVFTQFSGQKGRTAECMAIPAESVTALEIRLTSGDITLGYTDGQEILVGIEGDTQDIRTMLRDDNVLSLTQGSTASAVFLFMRGIRRTNVELCLPRKVWESVSISTINGDVDIEDGLVCKSLKVSTSSGDLDMERVSGENMELKLASGDINGGDLNGDLYVESQSGDIDVSGCLGRCELFSASGDVSFAGVSREVNCSSTSGDVELNLKKLPERIKGSSVSGDCEITVPADQGFHLSYRTVSGSFSTDVPMSGRVEKKCGDVMYGETVCGEISLSSVSGDVSVRVRS